MKKPSKASFEAGLKKAKELNKPVIVGWGIMQRLNSPAIVEWPKHGKADQKGNRWFRQNYRYAWIVSPDGSAYNVFDPVPTTFAIGDPDLSTVPGYIPGHGILQIPKAALPPEEPAELRYIPAFIVQQQTAAAESEKFVKAILATGKATLNAPPDGFLWTGTERELSDFLKSQGMTAEKVNPTTGETNEEKEARIARAFGIKP